MTIGAGTISALGGGQVIRVQKVHQHPEFNPETFDNDISILELDEDLIFNQNVNKLDLPTQDQSIADGAFANVTGWGRVYEGGNYPAVLLSSIVTTVNQEECRDVLGGAVTDNMLCASNLNNGQGTCQVYNEFKQFNLVK